MLYKYLQAEFPYADLIAVNGARGKTDPEYELLDTGVFDESRYFDVVVEAGGWPDNQSCRNLAAWSWSGDRGDGRHVVVVNLSGQLAQGRLPLDWPDLPGRSWWLTDILGKEVFERDGVELASPGLYVALDPWQFYVLALR